MSVDDLWVITSYFNPCRYRTKRENFDAFMAGMRSAGANVLVAELAFGDDEFELPAGEGVLQLRGTAVMWQKERLLNVAAATLPRSCRKVAWLDCDLILEDPDWLRLTSEALDRHVVVQPFTGAVRLPRGAREHRQGDEEYRSFASVVAEDPQQARNSVFLDHGHTGFAWAARRELFDACGLYDACLTGSADHLMAHAFAGAIICPCVKGVIGMNRSYFEHFWRWGTRAQAVVGGKIGAVPGRLLHLWHGDLADRRYAVMNQEFRTFDFDPQRDLRVDENGLWEWNRASAQLRGWATEFFGIRKEDGEAMEDAAATN